MTDEKKVQISDETSTRVCKHMNEDHGLTIYAMARTVVDLPADWTLTDAKLKKVTPEGCEVEAITCSGELCEMKQVVYPFTPPLASAAEVKKRMIVIHHSALSPEWGWIWTKPFAFKCLVTVAALTYASVVLGGEQLVAALDQTHLLKSFYPRTDIVAAILQLVFYVTFIGHIGEAAFAAHTCVTAFKLKWTGTLQWMVMIMLVGYPILQELMLLQKVQQKQKKEALEAVKEKEQ
jgi:hypothetical protein